MTRIFLIRHGETEWNAEGKYISFTDKDLSDKGLAQAEAVAKRLAEESLETVFVSPRSRALQTAEYVAQRHSYKPVILPELDEINFGDWEGLTFKDIEERYPGLLERWIDDPSQIPIPEGEPWKRFAGRVRKGFERMTAGREEGALAVVSHGGTIRAVLIEMLGLEPAVFGRITIEHGAVTVLDVHREWAFLRYLNDACHLKNN